MGRWGTNLAIYEALRGIMNLKVLMLSQKQTCIKGDRYYLYTRLFYKSGVCRIIDV